MLAKEQSSLFVFNEHSHLQGVVHYDPKLKNVHQRILDEWNLGSLENTHSVDTVEAHDFDEGAYDAIKIEAEVREDGFEDDDGLFFNQEDE